MIVTMVKDYVILAVSCFVIGVVMALATIAFAIQLRIDVLGEYIWILTIPAVLVIILNVTLLELYRKFRKKK